MRVVGLIVACGALFFSGCEFLQSVRDFVNTPIFQHPTPTPTPAPKRSKKHNHPSAEESPVHRGTHYSKVSPTPTAKEEKPAPEMQSAKPTATPVAEASSTDQDFPTAKIVLDKPGYVFSPYEPTKFVDVTGYASGSKVKDPYTGKIFLVP